MADTRHTSLDIVLVISVALQRSLEICVLGKRCLLSYVFIGGQSLHSRALLAQLTVP